MTSEPQRSIEPPIEAKSPALASDRPRVLLVGPMPPTTGGVTTFMLNLMASGLAADFEFIPFTTSRPPKKDVIDNWGYHSIFRGGIRRVVLGMAITACHLAAFPFRIVSRRIDLVQVQASDFQAFWESALYVVMARLLRRAVVLRIGGAFDLFHGSSSPMAARLIAAVLRLPQMVVAQSAFARDYIRRAGRAGALVVLPNWFRGAETLEVIRGATTHPVFLFIAGSEALRKGVNEVLAAAEILQHQESPARFHFLGMTPALSERVKSIGLTNIQKMEEAVPHDRVLEAMRHADGFLLPSHGEGFPNSLIEAMASGMACIATPVGAVPEIIAGGGALEVMVGDAAALATAIDQLARDRDLRLRLGRAARGNVRSRYTEGAALPALAGAYRAVLPGACG